MSGWSGKPGFKLLGPLAQIGLPERESQQSFPNTLSESDGNMSATGIQLAVTGRRVSNEERLNNLRRLVAVCRENGIALVIMHPAGAPPKLTFHDFMHPSAAGHEALAEGLSPFILGVLERAAPRHPPR